MSKVLSIIDHYQMLANDASGMVYKSVVTIFNYESNRYKPIGSALVFQLENEFYLISSAHVLSYSNAEIFIPIRDDLVPIEGELWTFDAIGNNIIPDTSDVAILRIGGSYKKGVQSTYNVLGKEVFDLQHESRPNTLYLIAANPESHISFDPKEKRVRAESFSYSGKRSDNYLYEKYGYSDELNILLDYDRRKITRDDKIIKGPFPHGMSGSGLWLIRNHYAVKPNVGLVGLLIRYVDHPDNIIVSVRINVVTEALLEIFGYDIPKTKGLRLKTKRVH